MADETTGTETIGDGMTTIGESQTTGTEQTSQTASTTGTEPVESYINPDGTLKEGWQNKHVPEEMRKDTTWLGMKKIDDMVSRISHLQGKLTTAGKGVFPINEKSTPEQIREFRQAMEIPESPDGYKFDVPENLAKYYDDSEMLEEAKKVLHGVNLNKQQFTAVMALDAMRMEQSEKDIAENPMEYFEAILPHVEPLLKAEGEKAMRAKWGDAFDSRFHYARMAIENCTKEGQERDLLLSKYGNDPVFADFIATMYLKSHTESNGVDTSLGHGSSSQNLQQRIDGIQKELTDNLYRSDRNKYNSLLAEKNKLYKQMYPEKG